MNKGKILIVDDSTMNIAIIEEILAETPYKLCSANNGELALKIYPEFQPDLILLDIMMPGMTGYEVCETLRQKYDCHCKIIFISAKFEIEDRIMGYKAGADDYITKPYNRIEFLSKINVFMRLQRTEVIEGLKSELLQFLTHEINTPLNAMIPSLELLKKNENLSKEEIADVASIALDGANKLNALFDKVKFLLSLKNGEWEFHPQKTNITQVVIDVISNLKKESTFSARNIDVKLPVELYLMIDEATMHFVLSSLVDNALRYSLADQPIEISYTEDEGGITTICVRNWPDKNRNILDDTDFSAFAHEELLYHSSGHGLSLSICDQIIKYHESTLSCVNLHDKSISFNITLPQQVLKN